MVSAMKVLILILVLPVAVYALLAVTVGRARLLELAFGAAPVQSVDFETLALRNTPNQYLVCPPSLCTAPPHAESPVFDEPPQELKRRWFAMIETEPRVDLVDSNAAREEYTFRVRTPVLHFPDDVTVQFIAMDDGRSTLAVYSRSHYGYSDLGVNRRRVGRWLGKLRSDRPQ